MKRSILVVFVFFSCVFSLKLDSPKSARKWNEIPEISDEQRVQLIQQETSHLTRGPCAPGETECPTGCCPQVFLNIGFLCMSQNLNFCSTISWVVPENARKKLTIFFSVQNVLSIYYKNIILESEFNYIS